MRTSAAILLDRNSAKSLQAQLATQLKDLIQTGQLRSGEPLPSSRELAGELRVSRNTVVYSYDRLISEGYLETRSRSGIFVSASLASLHPGHHGHPATRSEDVAAVRLKSRAARSLKLGMPRPFRPCQPDVNLFPLTIWNRLRGHALRSHGLLLLQYQESCRLGLPALREALAGYLRENRGVRCDWRQIAVTAGSQQALFILASLLLRRRDRVYMEDPGYPGAQMAWKAAGAIVDPAVLDEDGMQLPPRRHRRYALLYTTPSRQFPMGMSLALHRRLALLEYAATTRTWIIEDDYDSEFRYTAPPLPSLQSLDRADRVIYVGTFSKVLCPALRLGYVVLPPDLVDDFERMRALMDDHGPLIDQATLAALIESGAFYSHIRRSRRSYAERQQAFLDGVTRRGLPLTFRHRDGGMNLTGLLDVSGSDQRWSSRCQAVGLDVPALSSYAIENASSGLVFGFTAFTPAQIDEGLDRLDSIGLGASH